MEEENFVDNANPDDAEERIQFVQDKSLLYTKQDRRAQTDQATSSGSESRRNSSILSTASSPKICYPLSTRKFDSRSSIILVGMKATGKSSLAVILSSAINRRLIDGEVFFKITTGMSRSQFKSTYGATVSRQKEKEVMISLLNDYRSNCVITCWSGTIDTDVQDTLCALAKTNPIIHVLREAERIQEHVKSWSSERINKLLEVSSLLYSQCSNLEFFNVSKKSNQKIDAYKGFEDYKPEHTGVLESPFLTLKMVARDFFQFTAAATGNLTEILKLNAPTPLASIPIEQLQNSYALSLPMSKILEDDLDIAVIASTADAFELRVDVNDDLSAPLGLSPTIAYKISRAVAIIRRNVRIPIIYHVERHKVVTESSEHRTIRRSDQEYIHLVQHGLRLIPDFLSIDLTLAESFWSTVESSRGYIKIIGDFSPSTIDVPVRGWKDERYREMYNRATKLGCDIVRFTQPASCMDDNFAVQEFRDKYKAGITEKPQIIAFNTGSIGRLSCLFNTMLSPVTHESIPARSRSDGDPLLSLSQSQSALFSSYVLDPMNYYLFGANVTYSLSPAMHNAAYKACGLPHRYQPFHASSLKMLDELIKDPHFAGSSVSLPYKTDIVPLLHSLSAHARVIGAVNTIIPIRASLEDSSMPLENALYGDKNRAGPIRALFGHNTDWIGMIQCIQRGLSPANTIRPSTTGLVVGAGGMARAAIYSLIYLGIRNIFLINRTLSHATKLANHYNQQKIREEADGVVASLKHMTVHTIESIYDPWPSGFKQPTVIVSCIPAHQIGDVPSPNFTVPSHWLESPSGGVVVDLAYKPLVTPLMKQIQTLARHGWVAFDGLHVLPEQGFAQFELFTGRRAPRKVMREVVLREYKGEDIEINASIIQARLENSGG